MNNLDPNRLFSIFEQGDEEVYKEHGIEDALNNPFVLMGMVIRGVDNYEMMDILYTRNYPDEYKNIKSMIRFKYFNRLFGYLLRIDSNNFDGKYDIGESYNGDDIHNGLDVLRLYYESIEHYEKCSVIKKYQDLLAKKYVEMLVE